MARVFIHESRASWHAPTHTHAHTHKQTNKQTQTQTHTQDAEVLLTEGQPAASGGESGAARGARRESGSSGGGDAVATLRSREVHTHTHARTHARTHTHTHTRTHARTHTQEIARRGDVALHCAELLNKWAAASPEYSKDLVMRAAEYSVPPSLPPRPCACARACVCCACAAQRSVRARGRSPRCLGTIASWVRTLTVAGGHGDEQACVVHSATSPCVFVRRTRSSQRRVRAFLTHLPGRSLYLHARHPPLRSLDPPSFADGARGGIPSPANP